MIIANFVVVLGSEQLKTELGQRFASEKTSFGEPITVLSLDKSDGVAQIDKGWRQKSTETAIKEYFFGSIKARLSPFTQSASFDELIVFKAPEGKSSLLASAWQLTIPALWGLN